MVRRCAAVVLWAGFLLLAASPSQAVIIVDTGTPPDPTQGTSLFDLQRGLGAEFTTTETFEITSIEGYIQVSQSFGSFTIGLYTDGGEIPGTELVSAGATVAVGGWNGITNLGYLLLPGTYWVTFEVRPGDTLHGYMPFDAPSPLANEAIASSSGSWFEVDDIDIGVRIAGDLVTTPLPEPSALTLLALAGLALGVFRRKH